jgi:probable F420-dependent oxidoreductase
MAVKINVTMPFDDMKTRDQFMNPEAVVAVAQTAERAGFNAALVTDHPVPTGRWLDAGGHHAQDPFVMLSFVAAATRTLRLQTGIVVLPYRNPFIVARSVATLDVFSRGRFTLSVGAGYLKGEYKALGVDFEQRNELMDEYIKALKAAWTQEEFTFEGTGYTALGNRILPRPVQTPHPPIYVGGNSRRAIRRVAELADGWNPFFTAPQVSATSRTKEITNEQDLAEGIAYLREHCEKIGRADLPEIVLGSVNRPGEKLDPQQVIDRIGVYRGLGVSTAGANLEARTVAEWCDKAEQYGADIIAKL